MGGEEQEAGRIARSQQKFLRIAGQYVVWSKECSYCARATERDTRGSVLVG